VRQHLSVSAGSIAGGRERKRPPCGPVDAIQHTRPWHINPVATWPAAQRGAPEQRVQAERPLRVGAQPAARSVVTCNPCHPGAAHTSCTAPQLRREPPLQRMAHHANSAGARQQLLRSALSSTFKHVHKRAAQELAEVSGRERAGGTGPPQGKYWFKIADQADFKGKDKCVKKTKTGAQRSNAGIAILYGW
jgi:hypothetical protein